jgi:hypothetical protein
MIKANEKQHQTPSADHSAILKDSRFTDNTPDGASWPGPLSLHGLALADRAACSLIPNPNINQHLKFNSRATVRGPACR